MLSLLRLKCKLAYYSILSIVKGIATKVVFNNI